MNTIDPKNLISFVVMATAEICKTGKTDLALFAAKGLDLDAETKQHLINCLINCNKE